MRRIFSSSLVLSSLSAGIAIAIAQGCTSGPPSQRAEKIGTQAQAISTDLVISQIYATTGENGTYKRDYIELFNKSAAKVNLAGYSLQYGSAAGNVGPGTSNIFLFKNGAEIEAGGYYLVLLAEGFAQDGGVLVDVPVLHDDSSTAPNLSGTAGKIALVNGQTPINCVAAGCAGKNIVDLVGYGATATYYEGTAAAPTSGGMGKAITRKAGNNDTDDNAADFEAVAANPHSSGKGPIDAGPPPVPDAGPAKTDAGGGGGGGGGGGDDDDDDDDDDDAVGGGKDGGKPSTPAGDDDDDDDDDDDKATKKAAASDDSGGCSSSSRTQWPTTAAFLLGSALTLAAIRRRKR